MLRVVLFVVASASSACSVPCDPTTAPARCEDGALVGCVDGVGSGVWEGLYITEGREACAGVCVEHGDAAACVDAPGTPCQSGDRDRCEGTDRVRCEDVLLTPTGAGLTAVWQRESCPGGTRCTEGPEGARCVEVNP